MKRSIASLLLLIVCSSSALAETVFVAHAPRIALRQGPFADAPIIGHLGNGSSLELLKSNMQAGFSLIRTQRGKEGWVKTHFLSEQKSPQPKISHKLVTGLHGAYKSVKDQVVQLKHNIVGKKHVLAQNTHQNASLTNPTATTLDVKPAPKLAPSKQQLAAQRQWFLLGAGVLLLGILIGLLIPKLFGFSRKTNWGSLR